MYFEPEPSDGEAHKLVAELKRLGASRVLDWLWVLPSDLEHAELCGRLRKVRRAEDFVLEKIHRTGYRALLHMAKQAKKDPSKPSMVGALYSLMKRGRLN